MKISIVIPNFNGENLLKKNLPAVIYLCPRSEIIVVDDCSSDKSVATLQKYFPKVRIVLHKRNLGFASCVNDGVRLAEGDLILLLNTDVVPEKNFLDSVFPYFNNPKVFAVGFNQKCIEKDKIIFRGRGLGKFRKGFLFHQRGEVDKNNTLWVSGGAAIFSKKIWDKLGGLYEIYNPFYWEDIDLSYRALKSGYQIYFEPNSLVVHSQEKSSIRIAYNASFIKKVAYRNQIFFVWLNINDISYLIQHFFYLPYHFFKALLTFDLDFIVALLLALIKLPEVIFFRRKSKKLWVVSDKDILSRFFSDV